MCGSDVVYAYTLFAWRATSYGKHSILLLILMSDEKVKHFLGPQAELLELKNLGFRSIEENLKSLRRGGGSAASQITDTGDICF